MFSGPRGTVLSLYPSRLHSTGLDHQYEPGMELDSLAPSPYEYAPHQLIAAPMRTGESEDESGWMNESVSVWLTSSCLCLRASSLRATSYTDTERTILSSSCIR